MAEIKAIIFDLDGVISDTQIEHFKIDIQILNKLGFNIREIKVKTPGWKKKLDYEKPYGNQNF